jgi:hypothetical protein
MIDPDRWELVIRKRAAPTPAGVTGWFNGKTSPDRKGWYDRMFTDGIFRQWWDGARWLAKGYDGTPCIPHWRQKGDYPLWRGLESPPAAALAARIAGQEKKE